MAVEQAHLVEVGVFGHDDQLVLRSVAPYGETVRFDKLEVSHAYGAGVDVGQKTDQFIRKVLVEEQTS